MANFFILLTDKIFHNEDSIYFFTHPSFLARDGALHILQVIGIDDGEKTKTAMLSARKLADSALLPADQRAQAINFLALQNPKPYTSFLEHLITPGEPASVQLAALNMLSALPNETVSLHLLKQWPSLTLELRDAALNTFLVRPFNLSRLRLLLDAIADGRIDRSSIGWPRSVVLMRDIPDSLKARSRALLTKTDEKRKDVIEKYEAALPLKGNEVEGKSVFTKNCSACHQRSNANGNAFGPDLNTVKNWTAEKLMANILDPGMSIPHGYNMWNVELKKRRGKTRNYFI